jgi:hypothetical protein
MNVNNARSQQYVAYWKSAQTNTFTELGITQTGTPEFSAKGEYVNLEDADQFFGRIASKRVGWTVSVRIIFKEVSYAELYARILKGQVSEIVDGVMRAYDGDTVPSDMNRDVAGELRLVPLGAPSGDLSECITIWKAAPQLDLKLAGDRTKYQTVETEFLAYPDPSRARVGFPLSAAYFRLGDPRALPADPDYIGAVFGDQPIAPYLHTPAFTLAKGDQKKTFWYGAYRANKAGWTLDVNGAVTSSATTLTYDNKSQAGESYQGMYLRNATTGECYYVVSDSMSTPTTGTLTIKRKALFSPNAPIADNEVLTVQDPDSIAILPVTERASFASSDPTKATIGNSASTGSYVFGDKGLATHVASGSTNFTATVGSTVSNALVCTAE